MKNAKEVSVLSTRWIGIVLLATTLAPPPALTQSTATDVRDEFLRQFAASSRKVVMLAEAMPESTYAWSPMEGVMPVAQVYMHIARYNYYYLESSFGISAPETIEVDGLESIGDYGRVGELLEGSVRHVRDAVRAMTEEQLAGPAMLYGREVPGWAVLVQLLAHMNEHVGQSIAYARMNQVVPPWSQ